MPLVLPLAFCWAALARAAVVTFLPIASTAAELDALVEYEVPFGPRACGVHWPVFWKTPCIAIRLLRGGPFLPGHNRGRVDEALAAGRAFDRAHVASHDPDLRPQREAYCTFLDTRLGDKWMIGELIRRVQVVCGPSANEVVSALKATLNPLKPHSAQCVLDAWPTATQLHLDAAANPKCVFGCDAMDHLAGHYWNGCQELRLQITRSLG